LYDRQLAALARKLAGIKVIVASPSWTSNGVNEFSVTLVRALIAQGLAAEILLTEENTDLVTTTAPRLPRPTDVPFHHLPVDRTASWGAHWGAMIRYLEERAPCIYIPNYDWRHSCVSPLLSQQVAIIGIVHGDEALHYDHVARLGQYWNAIISVKPEVTGNIQRRHPDLMRRLAVISYEANTPLDMAQDYIEVLARIMVDARQGIFQRPRGILQPPPAVIAGITIFPIASSYRHENLGLFPREEPDFLNFKEQIRDLPLAHRLPSHKITKL
jgi:hypothetical protein